MPQSATTTSLRERKRAGTWSALHEAAATLALAHARLSGVTIDAIVAPVNVSARTFFNYFDSKEDAILGFSEPRIDDRAIAEFNASTGPLASRAADFFFDVMRSSRTSGSGRQRRAALIRRHPELASRQIAHFVQVEGLVRDAVLAHLSDRPSPGRDLSDETLADALVAASSAAHRIAIRRTQATTTDADDRAAMHRALSQLATVTRDIR